MSGSSAPGSRSRSRSTWCECRGRGFAARVDLAWPDRRVALEYDGVEWHGTAAQLGRDRARLNALLGAGWVVLHATARTLRDARSFATLLAQTRSALQRPPIQ